MDYKQKYKALKLNFESLNHKYSCLWTSYQRTIEINGQYLQKIQQLTLQNNFLKGNLQEDLQITKPVILSNQTQKTFSQTSILQQEKPIKRGKLKRQSSDLSLDLSLNQQRSLYFRKSHKPALMEAFVIVGPDSKKSPSIIFEYPSKASTLTHSVRAIIPDFCFPQGLKIQLRRSFNRQSSIPEQQIAQRNSNWFIYTIKPDHPEDKLIYVVCLRLQRVKFAQRCYCILTKVPAFDLHFSVLKKFAQKKNQFNDEVEVPSASLLVVQKLYQKEIFSPGQIIEVDKIKYQFPEDLSELDTLWVCSPLCSVLKFHQFMFILSAVMQEKSIVFVSQNLGILTSCVLGIQALMRPFQWPNILICVLPDKLQEILDAPVPVLAGTSSVSNQYRKNPNVIWVLLDQPSVVRRIDAPSSLLNSVQQILHRSLRRQLRAQFTNFSQKRKFRLNGEQKSSVVIVSKLLKSYWTEILEKCNRGDSSRIYRRLAKAIDSPEDKAFFKAFCNSQIFMNAYLEIYENGK